MAKIKQWWNTPISKMFDDKEHIKYTVAAVVIVVAIIITLLFFVQLRADNTTTDTGTYIEKQVDTTVSQTTVITTNNGNQSTILFDTIINGTFGIFGNKITMVVFACVFAGFIGLMVRRRMRIMTFIFIQLFCFIAFGLNVWAIIVPFAFLLSSIISSETNY